ncbi:MAG: aminotransferase class IV [Bacteroidales bacterium]|nr:aminotransferase class IV [Bacteroidales bacterium]
MDTLSCDFYVIDNKSYRSYDINNQFNNSKYLFYEVLRTTQGILIFIEDHLERLMSALKTYNYSHLFHENDAKENLTNLLLLNRYKQGNIKFLCRPLKSKLVYASYYIPHLYPDEAHYKCGVDLLTFRIERNNPQIKQIKINNYIKNKIQNVLLKEPAYEILLINHKGFITEGSRSNFFLIKNDTIYSASEKYILPGITRKYVLEIIKNSNIKLKETDIALQDLEDYESAFITGTSPKVLPVRKIDNFLFNPDNPVLGTIMRKYNDVFNSYIQKKNIR